MDRHTTVALCAIPDCAIDHRHGPAYADARIPHLGQWGYVCKRCFTLNRCELGLGKGQRLILDH